MFCFLSFKAQTMSQKNTNTVFSDHQNSEIVPKQCCLSWQQSLVAYNLENHIENQETEQSDFAAKKCNEAH